MILSHGPGLLHRIYSRVYLNMPPKLELIAAACENMGIGANGNLPWRLKTEMAFFTRMTTDTKDRNKRNVVLMGRRTWECIPGKYRPLKNRINMVLTSQLLNCGDEAIVCKSIPHALDVISEMQNQVERIWVIGGSSVYKSAMESPHFGRLYLTRIKKKFECDTFFPLIPNDFVSIEDPAVPQGTQEENGIEFVYEVYERR
ncbi:dihydrofolate reductase isoform X1 [Temnothorax curvispinosus]|uniref:dihydrofolate reductase n=1 Tax=Temnothorax curvispinosus TaxID=300111 RepID=A0A6J1QAW4_9HYME|nr:dihydrofolate reductase isoform X1 [Temnothorax curvispinosus]